MSEVETAETNIIDEVTVPSDVSDLQKKMKLKGTVKRLELYGAFVDIGLKMPAVLHSSHLGKRVNRVSDILNIGEEIEVWVDRIDQETGLVNVTMQRPLAVEWNDLTEGDVYKGVVKRLENFGAFIDIGAEKEGLAHVSELSHEYVRHPNEVLKVDDEVEVKVLDFSRKQRRINLSLKALQDKPETPLEKLSAADIKIEDDEPEYETMPTAMEMAYRSAMGDDNFNGRKQKKGKKKKGRRKGRYDEDIYSRTLDLRDMD